DEHARHGGWELGLAPSTGRAAPAPCQAATSLDRVEPPTYITPMGIEQEESLAFRLRHADPDWSTNDKPYRFSTFEVGPIRAWAQKNPDLTVEFHVYGPLNGEIVLDGKMPPVGDE